MKTNLTIIFLLLSFTILGQGSCFEEYKKNSEKYDSLKLDSNGKFSIKKANEINNKIIKGLVGCKIPDFIVKTIDGKALSTTELKGKIIVLNFWFTTCSPCVAEIPALNKLMTEYTDSNVVFIAFSTDDSLTIEKFLKNKKFNYDIVSSTYDMRDKFCIFGYPTNMVFDKKGILRQILNGGQEVFNKIKPTIDKYLKEN